MASFYPDTPVAATNSCLHGQKSHATLRSIVKKWHKQAVFERMQTRRLMTVWYVQKEKQIYISG